MELQAVALSKFIPDCAVLAPPGVDRQENDGHKGCKNQTQAMGWNVIRSMPVCMERPFEVGGACKRKVPVPGYQ
jgi:hypothetical protein